MFLPRCPKMLPTPRLDALLSLSLLLLGLFYSFLKSPWHTTCQSQAQEVSAALSQARAPLFQQNKLSRKGIRSHFKPSHQTSKNGPDKCMQVPYFCVNWKTRTLFICLFPSVSREFLMCLLCEDAKCCGCQPLYFLQENEICW